jgi:hypothetical protein
MTWTLADLLAVPAWDLASLRAEVDAAPRSCADAEDLFDVLAELDAMAELDDADIDVDMATVDGGPSTVALGRAVCGACPARFACAAMAMSQVEEVVALDGAAVETETRPFAAHGMYGGLTGAERAGLLDRLSTLLGLVQDGAATVMVTRPPAGPVCPGCGAPIYLDQEETTRPAPRVYCEKVCRDRHITRKIRAAAAARAAAAVGAA